MTVADKRGRPVPVVRQENGPMSKLLATIPIGDIIGFGHVTIFAADGVTKIGMISVAQLLARKPAKERQATPTWRKREDYYPDVAPVRRAKPKGVAQHTERARTKAGVVAA
jgi:hypothetical protein